MITAALSKKVKELSAVIEKAYQETVTLEEAEKLAARFLHAQMLVADALKNADLDARMKKSGVKAVKAAIYQQEATKSDKKPSDTFLQSLVDMNELVVGESKSFDEAEVDKDFLQNVYNIFKEAHIYFRGISKGRFE